MVPKQHKLALLGAVGGIMTLGAAVLGGRAMAQTPAVVATPSGTPSAAQQQHQAQQDQFLNDLAKNLGVDRTKLDTALKTAETQEIDTAVQSGKLTQAEATQRKQDVANGRVPLGFGGLFGDHGGPGGGIPANVGQAIQDAVSKALGGETRDQVRADLQAGKTPDQIAQAHGTSVQAVHAAVAAAAQPLLDQAVQAGTLTAAQEQQILTDIKSSKRFGFGGHGRIDGPRLGADGGSNGPAPVTTPTASI